MSWTESNFADAACDLLTVLEFRCLPFALYVAASGRIDRRAKLAVLSAYAALVASAMAIDPVSGATVVSACVALAYFAAISLGVHQLSAQYAAARVDKLALFVLLAALFVLVPSLLVPGPRSVDAQLLGWDLMFSGYSYCVDASRLRGRPSRRECLFFMLVDPTYVFVERGKRVGPPAVRADAVRRSLSGVAWLALHRLTLAAAFVVSLHYLPAAVLPRAGAVFYLVSHALATYFAHYGTASVVIGLMAMLGFHVPERYERVYLARDPADFWRRWNTYLGHWARRYVFTHLALVVPRTLRRLPLRAGIGVALLLTFGFIGLMHDYVLYTQNPSIPNLPWATLFFVLQGAWLLGWAAASQRLLPMPRRLGTAVSRVLLWSGLIYSSGLYFAAS